MRTFIPCLICVLGLAGCGTARRIQTHAVITRDSVAVRYDVRRVTVYDTMHVALPQESAIRETPDTTSRLETSVAVSEARIRDGRLYHSLQNKPSVPLAVPHDTVYITHDSIVYKEREEKPAPEQQPAPKPSFFKRMGSSIADVLSLIGAATLIVIGVRVVRRRVMKC